MKTKLMFTLFILSLFLFGCAPAETPEVVSVAPDFEQEANVEEEVVVPAHEPEPQQQQPTPNSRGILTEHVDSDHFLRAHPDQGETVSELRKIEIIFNYPLTIKHDPMLFFD